MVIQTTLLLDSVLSLSLVTMGIYLHQLRCAIADIKTLSPPLMTGSVELSATQHQPMVSVIIPAYNEVHNIYDCVTSVLNSTSLGSQCLEVWVVDDQSTDETLQVIQTLNDPRLHVLPGLPRPTQSLWVGKTWACTQAADRAQGDFLLFIDADVRLKPGAVEAALQLMTAESIDLLNCIPAVVCGSLVEWLVQPLIFISMLISFNQPEIHDPTTDTAFAAGPFMMFRRTAYEQIGGHRAVADQVAEDVALARSLKHKGLMLRYRLAPELATLRMYTSLANLWEGWTKVLYVGANRSIGLMLLLVGIMLMIYTIPWLGLAIAIVQWLQTGGTLPVYGAIILALATIGLQYQLRRLAERALNCSPRYWWLQSVGGAFVALLAIASIVKTETGWGWTWRGRPLRSTQS